ncbi:hypothetical protein G7054_g5189 [Neopestalotiopsis clavispora]|nr:hypothetical protein G7054_g5189 [Neopestalotiopsis clavispora]
MSDPEIYTVGWICALEIELVAAASFLDEEYEDAADLPVHDNNSYVLGRIGKHNVVIAALPNGQYGLVSAATVARDMVRSFPKVRIGLMVGIAGGAPSPKHDIRLGDIVVSSPSSGSDSGGVFQYDYGRSIQDSTFVVTGHLNQPPPFMLTAISTLRAQYRRRGHDIEKAIEDKLASNPRLQTDFQKPHSRTDILYVASYKHAGTKEEECTVMCDDSQLARSPATSGSRDHPTVHYGIIASANQLMRDATLRDKFSAENDVLCFEMEAAGLMNQFPCVVIRGICDYSDTHKNKVWQGYAAMAAAAYAKDLLQKIAPRKLEAERKLIEVFSSVKEKLDEISTVVEDTQSDLRSKKEGKYRDNVTRWLAAPDVSSNLNRATEARHSGSGQRLINNQAYQEWKTQPNSFLWLHGIPGCGKTVLTSTIIGDLRASPNCAHLFYYFYFDFTDNRKQTFENCIRSLLSQMYHTSVRGREEVDALYEFCNKGKDQPSSSSLQKVFASIIRSGETWIILDALDECKVRDSLLRWLCGLRNKEVKIHIIATSRREQDIEVTMKQLCCSQREKIAIDSDLLEADIKSYVHEIIEKDVDFDTWKSMPKVREEIETSLVGKAHGMFRWVWCQLSALKKCKDRISLRKTLASLPNNLDETYSRILADIPREYIDHAFRILQFLTYSERPMGIKEVVDAIAVKLEPGGVKGSRFDVQDRMPNPTDIVGYCSGLAVIVEREEYYSSHQDTSSREREHYATRQELQLAHFSVREYLTSDRLENNISPCLPETSAQSIIAGVCLAYLLEIMPDQWAEDDLWSGPQYPTPTDIERTFPFASYSTQYWATHFAVVEDHSEAKAAFDLAKELLLDHARMKYCFIIRWASKKGYPPFSYYMPSIGWLSKKGYLPSLYYVSSIGWKHCCKMLLDEGVDINERGGPRGSAVYAAFHGGHQEIVDILLRAGADPNPPYQTGHSLLWFAVKEGHEDRVRFLLDSGAQVDVSGDSEQRTPLSLAVSHGFKAVTRVLLEHGAQVENVDDEGYTPLAKASELGYVDIMTYLLSHGAKVSGFVDKLKVPMILACRTGQTQAVELLIKHKAFIYGVLRSSHLFNETRKGYRKALELLIVAEGGHRIEDRFGRSLLTMATIHNKPKIVDVLLAAPDLDVNAKDHWGATAISFAARYGFTEIFRKIAALSNVDFDAEDNYGRTSLWWARQQRYNDIASDIVNRLQRQNNDKLISLPFMDTAIVNT